MGSSQSIPAPAQPALSSAVSTLNEKLQTDKARVRRDRLQHVTDAYSHLTVDDGNDGTVSIASLPAWESAVTADPAKLLARTVLSKANIMDTLVKPSAIAQDVSVFNVTVPTENKAVTNQKSSGRCWLFATTNVARTYVKSKYNLPHDFELSQAYLFFYDKLEKSNFFLEQMIDLAEKPLETRVVQYLYSDLGNDGGQYDMAVNLVEKYGFVPKSIYPESFNSSNSGKIDSILSSKLREFSFELRALYRKSLDFAHARYGSSRSHFEKQEYAIKATRSAKTKQMAEIYSMLSIACGAPLEPTAEFTWEYYDVNGKFHALKTTPLDFYKTSGFNAAESISLVHDTRHDPYQLMTVDRLGNVFNARPVLYVNAPVDDLKAVVVSLLKAGKPVWFGADVGKAENTPFGIMDLDLHDFKNAFGTTIDMTKAERLQSCESAMTHAMVFSGVHLDNDGKPVRFRVENSWGDAYGDKGYFVMTSQWFDQFVYQVVAPRSNVPKKLRDIFETGKPSLVLPPYDPMGSLAKY